MRSSDITLGAYNWNTVKQFPANKEPGNDFFYVINHYQIFNKFSLSNGFYFSIPDLHFNSVNHLKLEINNKVTI